MLALNGELADFMRIHLLDIFIAFHSHRFQIIGVKQASTRAFLGHGTIAWFDVNGDKSAGKPLFYGRSNHVSNLMGCIYGH